MLEKIGQLAFKKMNVNKLFSIKLLLNLKEIGDNVFHLCKQFIDFKFDNIEKISDYAFKGSSIENFYYTDKIGKISSKVFVDKFNLEKLKKNYIMKQFESIKNEEFDIFEEIFENKPKVNLYVNKNNFPKFIYKLSKYQSRINVIDENLLIVPNIL